jgi:hypothetical protein
MITALLSHPLVPMSPWEATLYLQAAAAILSTLLVDGLLILADRRWPGAATLVWKLPPLLWQVRALRRGEPLHAPIQIPHSPALSRWSRWVHSISRDAEKERLYSTSPTAHFS